MQPLELAALFLSGAAAGTFGALFGLGGGILIVPLLVVALDVPIHNAIATSLVAVIATSSAASARNLAAGFTNVRLGVTLEMATVAGAIAGSFAAGILRPEMLMVLFAAFLGALSIPMFRARPRVVEVAEEPDSGFVARLHGSYFDPHEGETVRYSVRRFPLAAAVSSMAGVISGLLGLGGGILQVPVLALSCGVPMKAATATSNFMIGVTALASVLVFVGRGQLLPLVTAATALGVIAGSQAGARLAARIGSRSLQRWFAIVLVIVAAQMAWKVLR